MTAAKKTNLWYLPALGPLWGRCRVLSAALFARRHPAAERFCIVLYLNVSAPRTRNARSRTNRGVERHEQYPPIIWEGIPSGETKRRRSNDLERFSLALLSVDRRTHVFRFSGAGDSTGAAGA